MIVLAVKALLAPSFDRAHPTQLITRNPGLSANDMVAGGLEVRERGTWDPIAVGGVLLPLVGLTTWLTALIKLDG